MKSISLHAITLLMAAAPLIAQEAAPRIIIDPLGHSGAITELLFRASTDELISVGEDKAIRFWDINTGELLRTLRGEIGEGSDGQLFAGALSKDDRYLAVAGLDAENTIRIIDLEAGQVAAVLRGHESSINCLDFSDDGLWLASGSGDATVRIWNLTALGEAEETLEITEAEEIPAYTESVSALDFASDGLRLVTGSEEDLVDIWKRASVEDPFEYLAVGVEHNDDVYSVAFSSGDAVIISGGADHCLNLWNGETGEFIETIDADMGDMIAAVAFSPDGQCVIASSQSFGSGTTAIYDLATSTRTVEFTGHDNRVRAVAWHPELNLVASAGGNDNVIELWRPDADADSGEEAGTSVHRLVNEGSSNWAVAFSDDREGVVAFGRTISPDKERMEQDLELAFDFVNFEFVEGGDYTRTFTEIEGATLEEVDDNHLTIGENNALETDPASNGRIQCYSLSSDGLSVFVGSDFTLSSFGSNPDDQGNHEILNNFVGHHGVVWALSPSRDGRYLASAADDQTVRLWNAQTGELLASLFVAADFEWVCWTPSGHYQASPGGERYIGWHFNRGVDHLGEFFPSSVFRDTFHNPEVVSQTVLLGSSEAAMTETGTEPVDLDALLPPSVAWVAPVEGRSSQEGTAYTVQAQISSPNGDLQELKLLLNGKAIANYDLSNGSEFTYNEEIELNPGKNRLTIFARNVHAGFTSEDRIIKVASAELRNDPDKPTPPDDGLDELTKPNLYVLAVGVSEFADSSISALEFCDDDATAIADFFAAQEGGLFAKAEVKLLVNAEATEASIQEGLNWLEKSATQKDIVVLFLASHGGNDDKGNFYMIPHDCDPANLRSTGVAWEDFGDVLGNLPSRVLMFLDTCHSGRLGANLFTMANKGTNTRSMGGLKSAFDNSEAIRELTSDEVGVVIMAASTGNESSLENAEWGHGAFTASVLAGLKGEADLNGDGIVHLVELDFYVAEKVKDLTQGAQHPTTVKPSTISRLPVAEVPD
jgi:WD40 repeat protein